MQAVGELGLPKSIDTDILPSSMVCWAIVGGDPVCPMFEVGTEGERSSGETVLARKSWAWIGLGLTILGSSRGVYELIEPAFNWGVGVGAGFGAQPGRGGCGAPWSDPTGC